MTLFNGILLIAIFFNGLLAGVFFIWTNAITPGIEKLEDTTYLKAFKSMNQTILNPLFYIVFFGSIIFSPIALLIQSYNTFDINSWLVILACSVYGLGVIAMTFFGNIPLNDSLDRLNLDNISTKDAKKFREHFQSNWNKFHLIRTLSSNVSFLLLLVSLINSKIL